MELWAGLCPPPSRTAPRCSSCQSRGSGLQHWGRLVPKRLSGKGRLVEPFPLPWRHYRCGAAVQGCAAALGLIRVLAVLGELPFKKRRNSKIALVECGEDWPCFHPLSWACSPSCPPVSFPCCRTAPCCEKPRVTLCVPALCDSAQQPWHKPSLHPFTSSPGPSNDSESWCVSVSTLFGYCT